MHIEVTYKLALLFSVIHKVRLYFLWICLATFVNQDRELSNTKYFPPLSLLVIELFYYIGNNIDQNAHPCSNKECRPPPIHYQPMPFDVITPN